jgi:hypothetical protein
VMWRKLDGTEVAPGFAADGNGDGQVDEFDLQDWQANFGATFGGGAGGAENDRAGSVPEPSSALLIVCSAVLSALLRRRA